MALHSLLHALGKGLDIATLQLFGVVVSWFLGMAWLYVDINFILINGVGLLGVWLIISCCHLWFR